MNQSVKLSKLRLSASNVRTAPDAALMIEPFAADLEARGVLQNLLVTPVARSRGMFEVFDGGRRLGHSSAPRGPANGQIEDRRIRGGSYGAVDGQAARPS